MKIKKISFLFLSLLLPLCMQAGEPSWTPTTQSIPSVVYTHTIAMQVRRSNVVLTNGILYCFVGDECRSKAEYASDNMVHFAKLPYNPEYDNTKTVTFVYYDPTKDTDASRTDYPLTTNTSCTFVYPLTYTVSELVGVTTPESSSSSTLGAWYAPFVYELYDPTTLSIGYIARVINRGVNKTTISITAPFIKELVRQHLKAK